MTRRRENPNFEKTLDLLSQGVKHSEIATLTGYKESTVKQYSYDYKDQIRQRAVEHLSRCVPIALGELIKLVTSATSEAVKLNAINRVLEANNMGVIHKSEIRHKTDAELDDMLTEAFGDDQTAKEQFLKLIKGEATLQ
jgi:hypothetical protein